MTHRVSDRPVAECNDYVLRDLQIEADANALAAINAWKTVKAFLEQALALTEGQNSSATRRLELLQRFQ